MSNALFEMINAVYHDKPFAIYRGDVSGEARLPSSDTEYKLLNIFEFIKAVSDTVFDMINAIYLDKPL